ncbi:MAG: endonuclease III [Syntrophomonas sp.]
MTNRGQALRIIKELKREYPNAGTLLNFNNIFELTIAVALSAQTTDERVNQVSRPLFARFPTPEAMAAADLEILEEIIRPVGLYRNKAKHIKALAQALVEQYDGRIPDRLEELIGLPGLGRKSANVILAVGFGKPGLGVDTHVQRVARRLGLASSDKPVQTELELKKLIPQNQWGPAHHLFIFHGRKVCKARRPDCQSCRIRPVCEQNPDK